MALAVCMLLDPHTERALRALWDRLEERGVPSLRSHTHGLHRPHLSYVVLLGWNLDAVRDVVAALAEVGGAWLVWQGVREHRGLIWIGAGVAALGLYGCHHHRGGEGLDHLR